MSFQPDRRAFIKTTVAAASALAAPCRFARAAGANEQVNLGVIGCGSRGRQLADAFSRLPGVKIAGLCDADQRHVDQVKQKHPDARTWIDMRGMLDDADIDAVVVAACNHWHALAAVWAMQAGKDVYVEKPLANTLWEGRQVVRAAEAYGRVCQVGTQQRSDPLQSEIKQFLHDEKALGAIESVRVNRYGVRDSIGKRDAPLAPPATVNYDLWLGPAQDEPIYRNGWHYDWHWMWNTGAGEMGNWGVHVLDDMRNNVFRDEVRLPTKILGGGGRVLWEDAGETPNLHFTWFEAAGIPVVIALCNIASTPGGDRSPDSPGPGSGYIAYCEGGRLEGRRGGAVALDRNDKVVRQFQGNGGDQVHQQNFIDAVRQGDPSLLTTPAPVGADSSGWCHLANIACRAGEPFTSDRVDRLESVSQPLAEVVADFQRLLKAHGRSAETDLRLSGVLEFDAQREQFVGDGAAAANRYLQREYRAAYPMPAIPAAADAAAKA